MWTALPQRRLCVPHDFDLLAVCLSLRRESSGSPLLHKSAPARGVEGTSGTERESSGIPHIQSTQTDMVAPQQTIPEDPETGPKPGTHLSKVSIHVGKVVSIPSSKPVPQPRMFKSAAVGRTDEKDFQSSVEERNACGRDWRVTEKLSNSAVSPEETSIYVSKTDLGPLVPYLPPTFQKEVQVEAEERGPRIATVLPSCPRSSGIPGVADLHQSPLRAWPDDRRALVQQLRSRRLPPPLHPGLPPFASGKHGGMTKMVRSALSCAGPGSPSSSETALFVSTCPQVSRIPGLPSVGCASRFDQSVWDRCPLWRKPSEREEPFRSLMKKHAVAHADMVQVMVAMLPTCSRGTRTPGFPSACPPKALSGPSMAGLLPTCPAQTAVAGMPFRAKVVLSFDRWHVLGKSVIHIPPRRDSVPVDEYLGPSCLWKVGGSPKEPHFVSLPLAPHHSPSMVDFVPACPSRSKVLGLPSKEFISSQKQNLDMSLMEDVWNRGGDSVRGILDSDKREVSDRVAMFPSCPVRACLLGMPSRTHKLLFHMETQRPDAGSQMVSKVRDYRALSRVSTRVVVQPLAWKDLETLRDMVDMSASCPKEATVFGLPSAPRQEACMVDLLPSCPGHTQICGLPSKAVPTPGACEGWLASAKTQWRSPPIRRGMQLLNTGSSSDESTIQAMTATRPSCPVVACVLGLPSALVLTDGPRMVNSSHGFTGESGIPGMSLGPHTKQIKWTMDKKTLLLPQKESTDLGTVMASMLPSCPNHLPYLLGIHLASMADMQACCPNTDRVLGLPSKHIHCSGQGWPGGDTLGWTARTEMVGKKTGERPVQTPVLEGSVNVQQPNSSSVLETSVQVGQTSPGVTSTEISQKEEEPAGKKTCSQTEAGFRTPREKEDAAAMGRG